MRVVSLLPSATEIVYALGLADELVGRSHRCDHPEEVTAIPRVTSADEGFGDVVDLDLLAGLEPDLVLAEGERSSRQTCCRIVRQELRARGVAATVVGLEPRSLEGIFNSISTVGAYAEAEDEAVGLVELLRERLGRLENSILERRLQGIAARRVVVLEALDPLVAAGYAVENPALTLGVMAAVFLSLTGGEALYADMGHFGRRPIRVAWFWIVMPALMLNYFGQGALVLLDPKAAENPFFLLAPAALQLPLVAIATCATVIASQAVISGAFSMTSQAVKLGFLPRLKIDYTSETHSGQIYVPFVNWTLLVLVVALVVGFRSSTNLAAAYGVAVATSMAITTLGVLLVARLRWDWPLWRVVLVFLPLIAIDWVFLVSNAAKIPFGGWFPLAFGGCLFVVFTTWKRGRSIVNRELEKTGIALQPFLKSLSLYPPVRVEGTAVFMSQEAGLVPHALLHNLKHNRVLHERVVFLSAVARNVPHIEPEDMADVTDLEEGCWQVVVRLGFQDTYDVGAIFEVLARHHDLELAVNECSFFLSRQNVIARTGQGMWRWRQKLFGWMLRNAQPASDFFHIPPNRVIEIGTQVVI